SSFVRRHVAPPSSDRNTPPSSASTIAQTRSWLAAETVTPIFPTTPLGRPSLRVISFQVSPPSVDLKRPLPGPPLDMYQGPRRACQKAAKRIRGFTGSIARSIAPAE